MRGWTKDIDAPDAVSDAKTAKHSSRIRISLTTFLHMYSFNSSIGRLLGGLEFLPDANMEL